MTGCSGWATDGERSGLGAAVRFELSCGAGGEFLQFGGGADRAGDEFACAVGAYAGEDAVGAGGAEGALEGADAGVAAVRREVAVAAFAVGAEFEHGGWP